MKSKKLLAVSLCGALCLSLAGFTYPATLPHAAPFRRAIRRSSTVIRDCTLPAEAFRPCI